MTDTSVGDNSLGSASVEVRATVAAFRRDLEESKRILRQATDQMTRSAGRAEQALNGVTRNFRRDLFASTAAANGLNASLSSTARLATAALAGAGSFAAAAAVVRLADQYTNLSARIRLVLGDSEEFAEVQERIFQAAQRTRAPVEDLTTLYVRLRQAIAGLGDAEALDIATRLSQSLVISGASAQESSAFLRQISQALASGVLRGDEFNSVMENNARFARLLADHLGVGVGALREMAQEGRLTADIIRGAISGGGRELEDEFSRMPLTIAGAYQQLQNAFARYVGQTDQGLGSSARLAAGISALADNFSELADAIAIVGALTVTSLAGRGINSLSDRIEEAFDGQSAFNAGRMNALRDEIDRLQDSFDRAKGAADGMRASLADLDRRESEAINRYVKAHEDARFGDGYLGTGGGDPEAMRRLAEAEAEIARVRDDRAEATRRIALADEVAASAAGKLAAANARLNTSFTPVGRAMQGFAASARIARDAAGSLINFLGGPWGVALAVAAGAFLLLQRRSEEFAKSQRNVENALSIVANLSPVIDEATNAANENAEAMADVARLTRDAADATDDLDAANRRATESTNAQTRAARAYAVVRREEAITTLTQAVADGERLLSELPSRIEGLRANLETSQVGLRVAQREGRDGAAEALQRDVDRRTRQLSILEGQLDRLPTQLPILREGLEQLTSGLVDVSAAAEDAGGGGGGGGGLGATKKATDDLIQSLLMLAANGEDVVTLMERAAAMGPSAGEAIRALALSPQALAGLDQLADPVLAFEETLRRLQSLRAAAGGEGAEVFTQAEVTAVLEMNRAARLGVDAIEQLQRAVDQGLISEDVAQKARESIQFLGEDFNRAREIISRGRTELENVRRELAEIQRLTAEGIFDQAGGFNAEAGEIIDLLERMARAAGDSREALSLLAGVNLPDSIDRNEAERRLLEAGREGAFDREERLGFAFRTEDVRDAISDGLFQAFSGGDWKGAFAASLSSVLNNVLRRVAENFANSIADALIGSTSGSGGLFSSVVSGIFGASGGSSGVKLPGKALGGDVRGGHGYRINEVGQEVFFPGVSGSIATNKALRNAVGAANTPRNVKIEIDAKTDGSVDLKIRAAEQRATVNGAQMGAGLVMKTLKSKSTS